MIVLQRPSWPWPVSMSIQLGPAGPFTAAEGNAGEYAMVGQVCADGPVHPVVGAMAARAMRRSSTRRRRRIESHGCDKGKECGPMAALPCERSGGV